MPPDQHNSARKIRKFNAPAITGEIPLQSTITNSNLSTNKSLDGGLISTRQSVQTANNDTLNNGLNGNSNGMRSNNIGPGYGCIGGGIPYGGAYSPFGLGGFGMNYGYGYGANGGILSMIYGAQQGILFLGQLIQLVGAHSQSLRLFYESILKNFDDILVSIKKSSKLTSATIHAILTHI